MGDQISQRQNAAQQAAAYCQQLLQALHGLSNLSERRPYLGTFVDADFSASTTLKYLDAATIGTLFDFVVPSLLANYADTANGGRNKQILNQVAPNL